MNQADVETANELAGMRLPIRRQNGRQREQQEDRSRAGDPYLGVRSVGGVKLFFLRLHLL